MAAANCRKCLKFEDASANMRQLFGSRGSGICKGDSFSAEAAGSLASDEDLDVLAARQKAEKQGVGKKQEGGIPKRAGGPAKRGRADVEWFLSQSGPA